MSKLLRGIRGATTVEVDQEEPILQATKRLLMEIIESNQIEADDVASVLVTVTHDLNSTFPAKVLRTLDGWKYVPVMCFQEIPVPGSLPMCIRLMLHVHTPLGQAEITHIYLERAQSLRPDLSLTKREE